MRKKLTPYYQNYPKNYHESDKISDEIDKIIEQHLTPWVNPWGIQEPAERPLSPLIEVVDTPSQVIVAAELPGMNPEDMDIRVSKEGILTITGEKKHRSENAHKGCYFSECRYGMVQRSVPLSAQVDTDKAEGTFENGVLVLTFPKKPETKEAQKKIKVKKK